MELIDSPFTILGFCFAWRKIIIAGSLLHNKNFNVKWAKCTFDKNFPDLYIK